MALTASEVELLEKLLNQRTIARRKKSILTIDENTPKNFAYLRECFERQRYDGDVLVDGKKGVILEGGARSRKTYSFIDFMVWLCLYHVNNRTVIILRDTYNSFHTTLFTDLETSLDEFGLHNPFKNSQQVTQMKIRNNRIHFKGADNANNAAGAPSYLLYFNEMLPIAKIIFMNYIMRCSGMWVGDFNPSVTTHWVFDEVVPRPDVGHLRTTFKDNPQCPVGMRVEIMGYEPFLPDSYEIIDDELWFNGKPVDDHNQPPPHPTNADNGTADLFMWKVYGLGLRGAMEGVIFTNVRYIDKSEWPQDYGYIYGNDFGFTADPNAFGRYLETETEIYCELLLYECIENPEYLAGAYEEMEIEKNVPIVCDSSDKYTGENKGTVEMVRGLQYYGYDAVKVRKNKSVVFHILSMKKKRINIVKNGLTKHAKKERENYRWKQVRTSGGEESTINVPIDKYNHFWDFVRYCHMMWNEENDNEALWE